MKRLEEKEVSPEGSNHVKLLQEENTYLREENKVNSEIIRMLSDKQNTYRCLHTSTTDTAVPEKQTLDEDTVPTKQTKTTDSWTNTDISNNKTDHASQDGNSLIISQLHHPSNEIKPKRIKANQSREICDKTKELKNLDHNHEYRNTVNKKVVTIVGDSISNGIDQSNESVCRMNLSKEELKIMQEQQQRIYTTI